MTLPVHAVGVGPGDPELLTLKGARLIREAALVVVPVGKPDAASHALAIVEGCLDRSRQEILPLVFPMTRDRAALTKAWDDAAREVLARWREGCRIVILTIGDPMLYSTALHLCRVMTEREPGMVIEYVPGVSSITATAARGGIPLGVGDERCAILPGEVSPDELAELCGRFGTLVFLKVARSLGTVVERVRSHWPCATFFLAGRVGTARELVTTRPETLSGSAVDYLSTLIVRQTPFTTPPDGGDP